jgi:hypothetical protein
MMAAAKNGADTAPTQRRLRELLDERIRRVHREFVHNEAAEADDTTVFVMMRHFDPADLIRGVREFALGLSAEEASLWKRSWTRTRFVFGNPANVASRLVSPHGSMAWLGPFPVGRQSGKIRLLKPAIGHLPRLLDELTVLGGTAPGASDVATVELQVAVDGLSLVEYLVHLHHTVAEATLTGQLPPDAPVRLMHRRAIDRHTTEGVPGYARVTQGDDTRLRLHTWLTPTAAGRRP